MALDQLHLDISDGHRPFALTATLRAGVACDPPYGLDLAGLLASRVRTVDRAQIDANEGTHQHPLPDTTEEDVDDLTLPLSRCLTGDDWHWLASCVTLVNAAPDPEPRHVFRQADTAQLQRHAQRPLPYWHPSSGAYRDVMMPAPVMMCSAARWWGVGDTDAIAALMRPERYIGRRRSGGEGNVLSWHMSVLDEHDPGEVAHRGQIGCLVRPVPTACATALHAPYRLGWYAIRPPSWHPSRLMELAMEPDPIGQDEEIDGA